MRVLPLLGLAAAGEGVRTAVVLENWTSSATGRPPGPWTCETPSSNGPRVTEGGAGWPGALRGARGVAGSAPQGKMSLFCSRLHLQHQGQCWGTNTNGRSLRATYVSRTGRGSREQHTEPSWMGDRLREEP